MEKSIQNIEKQMADHNVADEKAHVEVRTLIKGIEEKTDERHTANIEALGKLRSDLKDAIAGVTEAVGKKVAESLKEVDSTYARKDSQWAEKVISWTLYTIMAILIVGVVYAAAQQVRP